MRFSKNHGRLRIVPLHRHPAGGSLSHRILYHFENLSLLLIAALAQSIKGKEESEEPVFDLFISDVFETILLSGSLCPIVLVPSGPRMVHRPKTIGLYREKRFSGSRVEDDAAILFLTAEEIRRHGVLVELLEAGDLSAKLAPRMAFGMCESARPLNLLEKWERLGYPVFNRPSAVRNCHRWKMLSLLAQTQTPVPTSLVTETSARNQQPLDLKKGIWVKRWDVQSTARSDVRLVFDKDSLRRTLREHRRRGVRRVILQEHIRRDPIKFYGIRDTGWFRCFYSKS